MKPLSRLFLGALIVILAFSAFGCQSQAAPTQAPDQPAAAVTEAVPAAAPSTVRVLAMQQAGPTPEEMDAIVAEFNKANPNIKVEIEYVSYDALHDKITTSMAANPPAYDVIAVDDIWYAEFANAGYLADISERITPEMRAGVFKTAWDVSTVDGKVYGMPWLLDQKYFFYNEKMLADAGFTTPPATWEELVAQSKVIKEKGLAEYPIVWSWAQAEAAICDWVTLLYGNGGTLLGADGQPAFNNAAGVETLTWMVNSVDEGVSNPASVSYVEEDVRNVFSQGKAAFASNWNYMYELANANAEESTIVGQVKVGLMPVFEKGKAAGIESSTINGSMGFSTVAKSANADAAWEYLKFLTSEPIQVQYSAHMLPIWQTSFDGAGGEKLQAISDTTKVMVPAFKAQYPFAYIRPKVTFYPEASKALQLAMQQALTKQATPQEALDQAAKTWADLIAAQ